MERLSAYFLGALILGLAACGPGGDLRIEPLPSQNVMVGETLRMPIAVTGGGGFTFGFEGPDDVPAFDRTASISGSASAGGEFRWTPLASHVGTHEVIIQLLDGGSVIDSTPVVINVNSSTDAAPTFVRPGPGNAYDLSSDPCIRFDIEVRDDDSNSVEIDAGPGLPDGATITPTEPKRAEFEWCPSDSQAGQSERWTIPLIASDGTHTTPLDYIAVLRGEAGDNCPGDPPTVTIITPSDGGRSTSTSGWEVRADVQDDMDLRDAPLLFYSTSRPDDFDKPDVTEFETLVMRPRSGEWTARIPSVRAEAGDSQTYYFLVSATDNDDPSGSACDHRTDSEVIEFEAVVGEGGGDLGECDFCTTSSDCNEGICAQTASGGVCVPSCSDSECPPGAGSCGATGTTDGAVLAGCGPVEELCMESGGRMCMGDDGREDDDSTSQATLYSSVITDGEACAGDPDFFRIPVMSDERITVRVYDFQHTEGDIDLELLGASGSVLASSASTRNEETVEYCFGAAGTAYARVFGYDGASNQYSLEVTSVNDGSCCTPDGFEDNNSRMDAATLTGGMVSASICPGDVDYFEFNVTAPAQLDVTLNIDDSGADLDLRLFGPSGSSLAASTGGTTVESVSERVTESGTYIVSVDGFSTDTSTYSLTVETSATSGCVDSLECPLDQVCDGGSCVDRTCQFTFGCPTDYACPTPGPGMDSECGAPCTRNSDCRALEACKWFPEGRYCARRGGGEDGDSCSDFSSCAGQSACLPWPGGLCARAGCATNSDCLTGTYCIMDDAVGERVCAPNCDMSDSQCRPFGYECDLRNDPGGTLQFVCVPE